MEAQNFVAESVSLNLQGRITWQVAIMLAFLYFLVCLMGW